MTAIQELVKMTEPASTKSTISHASASKDLQGKNAK